jgi:competence protein ComEC
MGFSFFAYILGYLTVGSTWNLAIHVIVIFSAIALQFFIRKTMLFLAFVGLSSLSIGHLNQRNNVEIPQEGTSYFRLYNIKRKPNHIQAYGEHYLRKNTRLIPTKNTVVCTLLNPTKQYQPGDLIASYTKISKIISDDNPGSFDVVTYFHSKGIMYRCLINDTVIHIGKYPNWEDKVEIFRQRLSNIFDQHLAAVESGLAKALLLGDGSSVDSSSKAAFSATGAIHVLAVSGMHVSLFAQILLMFLGLFHRFVKKRTIQVVCILVLWYYAILTGLSPSVVRSVTMFTMLQIAQFLGKESPQNHSVLMCAYIMVVIDPNCMMDIGFQLSFLAVLGIFNFHKPMENLFLPKNRVLRFLWSTTCVALAAQSLTIPLTLYYFHTFPNYFLLANLGVAVISVVSMYLGFLYLFVCAIPFLGEICALPFAYSLQALNHFLKIIASIPGAVAEGYVISSTICILLLLAIALLFYQKVPWIIRCVPFTVIMILITVNRYHRQHENHLYLLRGKTPVFVIKQGTTATLFLLKNQSKSSLNTLCTNYRKIYTLNRLDTVYLQERDSLIISNLTILRQRHQLTLTRKKSKNSKANSLKLRVPPKGWDARKIMLD